jgi:hypothetical protein
MSKLPKLENRKTSGGLGRLGRGDGLRYWQKVKAAAPLGYYMIDELSGAVGLDNSGNGYNGSYTGCTLGQAGIGDGKTSGLFGVSSRLNLATSGIIPVFNPNEFTILKWYKVQSESVWTDATIRYLARINVDGNNDISIYKSTTANRVSFQYTAGGVGRFCNVDALTSTGYIQLAMTISKSADQMKAYVNATQVDATKNLLGNYIGTPSSFYFFNNAVGYGSHAVVFNRALSLAEIQGLFFQ